MWEIGIRKPLTEAEWGSHHKSYEEIELRSKILKANTKMFSWKNKRVWSTLMRQTKKKLREFLEEKLIKSNI